MPYIKNLLLFILRGMSAISISPYMKTSNSLSSHEITEKAMKMTGQSLAKAMDIVAERSHING